MSKEISGICTSLVAVSDGLTGINSSVAVKQILNLVVGSVFSFIVWLCHSRAERPTHSIYYR